MGVEIKLDGKHAIVTGGADGIGRASAQMLAQAGADVWIADMNGEGAARTAAEIAQEYGVKTGSSKCNVTVRAEVEAMVDAAVKEFGCIDILHNIAGLSRAVDFMELKEDIYDLIMDVNVKGTYLVDQAVLRVMIPRKQGKIVNMSSMSGKTGMPTNIAYTASKFAVMGITQGLAKYVAEYNINVNAVCPGIVKTQIWERLLQDIKDRGEDADAYWEMRMSGIPLHRPQTVEDIAHMFLYLSSDFADNMTGQGINVTGGLVMN